MKYLWDNVWLWRVVALLAISFSVYSYHSYRREVRFADVENKLYVAAYKAKDLLYAELKRVDTKKMADYKGIENLYWTDVYICMGHQDILKWRNEQQEKRLDGGKVKWHQIYGEKGSGIQTPGQYHTILPFGIGGDRVFFGKDSPNYGTGWVIEENN